ncbi:MAG: hypothetical protein JNL01_08915 [Bdellovibrionales bacterium]|nr:hypothetical protein [Bdellovibrionales bacterium]
MSTCKALFRVLATLTLSTPAFAQTVTSYGVSPYSIVNYGGTEFLNYANDTLATTVDTDDGFYLLDILNGPISNGSTAAANHGPMQFDVFVSSPPSGSRVILMVKAGSKFIGIAAAGIAGTTLTDCATNRTTGYCHNVAAGYGANPNNAAKAAIYTSGQTIRLQIYPADICAANNDSSLDAFCTGVLVKTPSATTAPTIALTVHVAAVASDTTDPASLTLTGGDTFSLKVMTGGPGAVTCAATPGNTDFIQVGDGVVFLNVDDVDYSLTATANIAPNKLIFLGNVGGPPSLVPPFSTGGNEIITKVEYTGTGAMQIGGFTNGTAYDTDIMLRDAAGALTGTSTTCSLTGVQTQTIDGFLAQDRCFIATSAFGSRNIWPVRNLRKFRDQWLLKSDFGRSMVRAYYRQGSKAADWLDRHAGLKPMVAALLVPVCVMAYILTHLWASVIFFGLIALNFVGFLVRRQFLKQFVASALLFGMLSGSTQVLAQDSVSPHIDQIKAKSKIYQRDAEAEAEEQAKGTYTQREKEKLLKEKPRDGSTFVPEGSSYTEGLKSKILEKESADPSEGYTDRIKKRLIEEEKELTEGGAIQKVQDGKSELEIKYADRIRSAMMFRVGVAIDRTFTVSSGATAANFSTVYGSGWAPDFLFSYEWQPYHSEWFGNIGFVFGGGLAFYDGKGRFQNPPPSIPPELGGGSYDAVSSVKFRFYTVPVFAGLNYRFNLFRIVRPYVQATPMLLGYWEGRTDRTNGQKGFSKGAILSGGIAIPMNFLSRKEAGDQYTQSGIQRMSLMIDFSKLFTIASAVNFNYQGISIGFLAEM